MVKVKISDRQHPHVPANLISRTFLWWTQHIFWKAYRGNLVEEDLYEPHPENRSHILVERLESNWNEELQRAKKLNVKPSLLRAIIRTFWVKFFLHGLLAAFDNGFCRTVIPYIVGWLVMHFSNTYTDNRIALKRHEVYLCASAMVIAVFLNVFLRKHYQLWCGCIGMHVRMACSSLVYRKVLRLNRFSMEQTATGNIVNLLSNDVSRFDVAGQYFHWIWVSLVQAVIATVFLWYTIRESAFIAIAAIVLSTVPVQGYLGRVTAKLRRRIAVLTDRRMRLMNEIVCGIQVIKMYAWEKPFSELVSLARQNEIDVLTLAAYVRAVLQSTLLFSERVSLFATLFSYWMFERQILPHQIFSLAIYINFLNNSLAVFYPLAVSTTAEAIVSVHRVQAFLLKNETSSLYPQQVKSPGIITLSNVCAQWNSENKTLNNITLELQQGQLCGIIGPVGSGKSSFLQALLGELPLTSGSVALGGTVSYSSQEPWIFTGTVRQNILFGRPYIADKYKDVVRVCALKRDFALMAFGDETVVGDRGITLSGGQRARINLARAVYQEADIYLLDDPLSAVDTLVGKHMFDECINGYLKEKTRILVTHQLQYLHKADVIANMRNGDITILENINDVLKHEAQLEESPQTIEESKERRGKKISFRKSMKAEVNEIAFYSSFLQSGGDASTSGDTPMIHYWHYFRAGAGTFFLVLTIFIWLLSQAVRSLSDYWMAIWSDAEIARTTGKATSYLSQLSTEVHVTVYGILTLACCLVALGRSAITFKICMWSSKNLHDSMFGAIIRSIMSFFDTNSCGSIVNRFSKDVGAMDEIVPNSFVRMSQILFAVCGSYIVIIISNYMLIISVLLTGILIVLAIRALMRAPKRMKALEARTRGPVFAHLADTINGQVTIRASKSQDSAHNTFNKHLDVNSAAYFWCLSTSVALGFYLDLIISFFIALTTITFLVMDIDNENMASSFGLAISQSLTLTGMLQTGILQMTEVVTNMTSVSRVLEYTKLKPEPDLESTPDKKPPESWPLHGKIQFDKVSLRYSEKSAPVLKRISLTVQEKHKVGVVGRTGAGKSSLLAVLFRLANVDGTVTIDNVDTASIGLHDLRKNISIIPQEPVLFSASMRYNLDPFQSFQDFQLWNALEEVELKESVSSLDLELGEGGGNMSVGQRQLVCLARAILRNSKVLVLDEATANVDPETDEFIQNTIRRKFKECTVLTIAHRLNTIMDSDRVLVMDAGRVREYDHPHKLLSYQNGYFYRMVQETGSSTAEHLMSISKKAYYSKQEDSDSETRQKLE